MLNLTQDFLLYRVLNIEDPVCFFAIYNIVKNNINIIIRLH